MPKTGPHPDKALTAIGVNRQSKPGWYADRQWPLSSGRKKRSETLDAPIDGPRPPS